MSHTCYSIHVPVLDYQCHGLQDEQPGAENCRAVRGQQAGSQQQHLHPEEHVSEGRCNSTAAKHMDACCLQVLLRRLAVSACVCAWQEGPGGDDLGAEAAEVLPGVAGGEAGGPERQAGGAPGEDEPAEIGRASCRERV